MNSEHGNRSDGYSRYSGSGREERGRSELTGSLKRGSFGKGDRESMDIPTGRSPVRDGYGSRRQMSGANLRPPSANTGYR